MYVIQRTEVLDGVEMVRYLNNKGWFSVPEISTDTIKAIRQFTSMLDAEAYIELEQCDPVYDRDYMGTCVFTIITLS